jgi:DNA mismatch repair protein MutH
VVPGEDILQSVVQRMTKVQRSGDIWRRNEYRIRLTRIGWLSVKASRITPLRPRKGLCVRGGVGFSELEF